MKGIRNGSLWRAGDRGCCGLDQRGEGLGDAAGWAGPRGTVAAAWGLCGEAGAAVGKGRDSPCQSGDTSSVSSASALGSLQHPLLELLLPEH